MTTYFLSQNPTVTDFNFGTANPDFFQNDTAPSSSLTIKQVGPNVVISDGTHTATLENTSTQQLVATNFLQSSDGSNISYLVDNFTTKGDFFYGTNGSDGIATGGGNDLVYANQGNDIITITTGAQGDHSTVYGGKGQDTVQVDVAAIKNGSNLIYGDLGNDTLSGGNGNDTIYGGQGNDLIGASSGNDLLNGDKGNDTILGGNGTDTIYGGIGGDTGPDDDTITTGTGNNLVYGATGNDTINIAASDKSTAYGGKGDDSVTAFGSANSQLIYGNLGNDTLTGGAAADSIYGGQGNDTIYGGAGNDFLSGDVGNDVLVGGDGADKLSGGTGSNFFDERDPATTVNPLGGTNAAGVITAGVSGLTDATADTITDFVSGSDKIVTGLADGSAANFQVVKADSTVTSVATAAAFYGAGGGGGGIDAYTLIQGGTDSTGAATGYLVIDSNAGGAADEVIKLTGDPSLKAADIIQNTGANFNP